MSDGEGWITLDRANLERLLDTAASTAALYDEIHPMMRRGYEACIDALREMAKLMPSGVLVAAAPAGLGDTQHER
jgi:hypothetical protein